MVVRIDRAFLNGKDDLMNYTELASQYSKEAERIKNKMNKLKSKTPGCYWERIQLQNTLIMMDDMYLDCLTVARHLKKRGGMPHETM